MNVYLDNPPEVASAFNGMRVWYPHVPLEPDPDYQGVLVVDEEGGHLIDLQYQNWSTPEQIQHAMSVELDRITTARNMYPNARIGCYAVPQLRYWCDLNGSTVGWDKMPPSAIDDAADWMNKALAKLLASVQVLCCTCYDPYPVNKPGMSATLASDRAYARANAAVATRVANGRLVVPFTSPFAFAAGVPTWPRSRAWYIKNQLEPMAESGSPNIGLWTAITYWMDVAFGGDQNQQAVMRSVMIQSGILRSLIPEIGDDRWTNDATHQAACRTAVSIYMADIAALGRAA